MDDELTAILRSLVARRADAAARLDLLDRTIADLRALAGVSELPSSGGDVVERDKIPRPRPSAGDRRAAKGQGVRHRVVALLGEKGGTWSAQEVINEFVRRGEPLEVRDPMNTVRSALSRAAQDGDLIRDGPGRYKAPRTTIAMGSIGAPSETPGHNDTESLVTKTADAASGVLRVKANHDGVLRVTSSPNGGRLKILGGSVFGPPHDSG